MEEAGGASSRGGSASDDVPGAGQIIPADVPGAEDGFGEPERANKLVYRIHENQWERTETMIAVGKKMFAWGEHRGCILVQDQGDGQIYVIKKSFDELEPVEEVYNRVKIEAIADLMAQCYNARVEAFARTLPSHVPPPRPVEFVPCFIFILAQRPRQPAVRVEPLIFNHDKTKLRDDPDAAQEELDTLNAFELFSYEESERSFVVCNPSRVGDFWTEPELHSTEGQLGGARNRGVRGINVFLLRHQYNDVSAALGLRNPSSLYATAALRQMAADRDEEEAARLQLPASFASANTERLERQLGGVEVGGACTHPPHQRLSLSLPPRFPRREEADPPTRDRMTLPPRDTASLRGSGEWSVPTDTAGSSMEAEVCGEGEGGRGGRGAHNVYVCMYVCMYR